MRKILNTANFKKTIKISLIIIAIFFSSLILAIGVLSIPSIQRFVTQKVAAYLSKELKTRVSVSRVVLNLKLEIGFEEFLVGDNHNDTLIYAKKMKFKLGGLNTSKKHIYLKRVDLENGFLNFKKYLG